MNKFFLIILGLFTFNDIQSFNVQVDSIRIIGFDNNVEFSCALQRQDFVDYVLNQTVHVDTTIVDSVEIMNILHSMGVLIVVDSLPYTANQVLLNGKLNRKGNDIRWQINFEKTIDNRLLLILFSNEQQEFIWTNGHHIDKGYYRYILPCQMIKNLKKYTHLFD